MLNICSKDSIWTNSLRPIGYGENECESFEKWVYRNKNQILHLHPKICEQWLYRHFDDTCYSFLPLTHMKWKLEEWNTEKFIHELGIWDEGKISDEYHTYCNASHDFEVFNNGKNPFKCMSLHGTWNIPIVVINSESGFIHERGKNNDIFYWLIEGHKRIRCLNALLTHGVLNPKHEVFILHY